MMQSSRPDRTSAWITTIIFRVTSCLPVRALLREDDLHELDGARAEAGGAVLQVEVPHAAEDLGAVDVALLEVGLEALVPAHERLVVVRAEVVHVLHDELALREGDHLRHGRQEAVGEDVLEDPELDRHLDGAVGGDAVHQREAVVLEAALDHAVVLIQVLEAHGLDHGDGHDAVELAVHLAVVTVLEAREVAHALALGPLAGALELLVGDGDARDVHAVLLGQEAAEAAPAAADLEHAHARLELELLGDQVQLVALRGVQVVLVLDALPVRARVLHVRVKPELEEVVAQVVVVRAHDASARGRLVVEDLAAQRDELGVPGLEDLAALVRG
ncbi:hypothetical protein ON010_g4243 [Phytophthora cinnamomi]|nr:hypothetical protein ON010_g4243 [Phytophthora cinnamomi]